MLHSQRPQSSFPSTSARRHSRAGFTLVELLVVIAIIGVMVGLLLPAVQAAREAARRMQCNNNIKQFGIAFHNYHDTYQQFPAGNYDAGATLWSVQRDGGAANGSFGWAASLLPFMEQSALYEQIDFSYPAYTPNCGYASYRDGQEGIDNLGSINNKIPGSTMPDTFRCPSTPRSAGNGADVHKDYGVSCGLERLPERQASVPTGLFHMNSRKRMADVTDGTSNTFMVLELAHNWMSNDGNWFPNPSNPFFWVNHASAGYGISYSPINSLMAPGEPPRFARGFHTGGINVGMADGSVRFISETIDFNIYKATSTINGREVVSLNP